MVKTSGWCIVVQKMIYISVCLVIREEIDTYSVKYGALVMTLIPCYWKHLWGCIHHIISYYTCHHICIRDILFHAHAYRIVRRDNSPRVQRRRGGGSVGYASGHSSRRRGANSRGSPWVLGSSTNLFPQRQALEHSKSPMFYKISLESFMFDALGYKSWIETTWCIELPCLDTYTFNLV